MARTFIEQKNISQAFLRHLYRLIPLGLAINTLLWGSVWWLVITGIVGAWRDIRHVDSLPEISSGDSAEPFVMPEHVLCPRCGYDQRGIIAQWTDACPLQGTCTECGLQYEWLDLLKPWRNLPRWCVENTSSQYRLVRRMIGTFVRSVFAPWRFWREIRITHAHRWRHMDAYLCVLVIGMYLLAALSNGVMAAKVWKIQAPAPGMAFNDDSWMLFLQAAALPLSNESLGSFTQTAWSGPITQPYPAPADIAPLAFSPLVMVGSLGML